MRTSSFMQDPRTKSAHRPTPGADAGSIRIVDDVGSMSVFFNDAVNIVLLRRQLAGEIVAEAMAVLDRPGFRLMSQVASDESGLHELRAQLPDAPNLAEDIHFWAGMLAEITGCALVGVRLARLESAMCPRFHVDRVTVRVVSTFAGLGTHCLATEDVDRRWLGHAAKGEADERSGLLRSGARMERAETGDVVLLKGEAWPGNAGRGAVHRSPPASCHEPRLVMTLDPLD